MQKYIAERKSLISHLFGQYVSSRRSGFSSFTAIHFSGFYPYKYGIRESGIRACH